MTHIHHEVDNRELSEIDDLRRIIRGQAERIKRLEAARELTAHTIKTMGLGTAIGDVQKFGYRFGIESRSTPGIPLSAVRTLRSILIQEEYRELQTALICDDIIGIADGIADLIYVLIGCALAYGIPLAEVWREVQKTNMAKEGGGSRADGKVLKPAGWAPPDIRGVLFRAGMGK